MRYLPVLVLVAACTPVAVPRVASDSIFDPDVIDRADWATDVHEPWPVVIGKSMSIYTSWAARCGAEVSDHQSHDGSGPETSTHYSGCHPVAYTATVRCAGASAGDCPSAARRSEVDGPFDVADAMQLEWKIVPRQLGPLTIEVTLEDAAGHRTVRTREFEVISWDDRRAPYMTQLEIDELKQTLAAPAPAPAPAQ